MSEPKKTCRTCNWEGCRSGPCHGYSQWTEFPVLREMRVRAEKAEAERDQLKAEAAQPQCATCRHGRVECSLGLERTSDGVCDPGDFNVPERSLRDVWEQKE